MIYTYINTIKIRNNITRKSKMMSVFSKMMSLSSKMCPNIRFEEHADLTNVKWVLDGVKVLNLNGCKLPNNMLPELPDTLETLVCTHCNLSALPKLPDSLIELICSNNSLETIPTLPPNLEILKCEDNLLSSLPDLPPRLTTLECKHNNLLSLGVLPNRLRKLNCSENLIERLPPFPNNLETCYCTHNRITELPPLPAKLIQLYCESNRLCQLPELPKSCRILCFGKNSIRRLPKLPSTLLVIGMNHNPIATIIGVRGNIHFPMNVNGGDISRMNSRSHIWNTFYERYYTLKCKTRLRKYLWEKIRCPKIEKHYHPSNLVHMLGGAENNEVLFDEDILEIWKNDNVA